ncbi:hypothetical protein FHR38_001872 [Micromonospora polyrhachis]|uniref:Uncharacterized protein n=1 Tax=Micromonospora polyrhachis TaxID=1282883 RepID=A0A7W7SNN8_9ACTN|nr:hypothetical protein [Micromonospora polyrhachis]
MLIGELLVLPACRPVSVGLPAGLPGRLHTAGHSIVTRARFPRLRGKSLVVGWADLRVGSGSGPEAGQVVDERGFGV